MTYPIAQLERRFTAFAIDRLLAWSLLAVVGVVTYLFVSDDLWTLVGAVAGAMVLLWLVLAIVLGVSGNSPGKAMTGLRVVHHGTGTPIGVGPALVRSLVLGISGLPTFGIGIATLAWTAVEDRGRQRRGWHDHLTNTVVVDVRPVVEVADDRRRRRPAPHRQPHRDAAHPRAAGGGGGDPRAVRALHASPAAPGRRHRAARRRCRAVPGPRPGTAGAGAAGTAPAGTAPAGAASAGAAAAPRAAPAAAVRPAASSSRAAARRPHLRGGGCTSTTGRAS